MSSKKSSIVASPPVKDKSKAPKVRSQKAKKKTPTILQAQAASVSPCNTNEVIGCVINPYLLTQFLFGYYGRGLSDADAMYDCSIVSNLVLTTLNLLGTGDITSLGLRAMPREIVDLYWSMRTTSYGKKTFACNLSYVSTFTSNVSSSGWTTATGLLDCITPVTKATTPFYNCTLNPSYLTGNQLRDVFAQYGSCFKMVDVLDKSRVSIDVFSFDVQTGFPIGTLSPNAPSTFALSGWFPNNTQAYIKQDSFVGLEVECKQTWMGSLRLCTSFQCTKANQTQITDTPRFPLYAKPVHAFPSVIGHQLGSNKGEYRGVVQLKLCPLIATLNDIIARLEAAAVNSGKTSAWQTAFTAPEIKLLAYGLWRAANSRYAACTYGVSCSSSTGLNTLETTYDSAGYKMFQVLRVPQALNDCLQSQKVYSDSEGVLLPCYTRLGDLNTLVTSLSYGTSGITAIPSDNATATYRYFANAMDIITKYKQFEVAFAGVSKITTISAFGNSLLDVTVSRDDSTNNTAGNMVAISSRRPLTTPFMMSVFLKLAYVSYDYIPASSVSLVNAAGGEDRTRIYRQRYFVALSGVDAVTKVIAAAVNDGFVPLGAEASNASTFSDGDFDNSSPPLDIPVSHAYGGLGYRLMSQVPGLKSVTYGNYGGPGYTAGSRDPTKWIHKDGKYIVPPHDDEDLIYKHHDENILAAKGDYAKEIIADAQLHAELKALSKKKDLSWFGHAAKLYFSPKAPRPRDEL